MIAVKPDSVPLDAAEFERQLRATGHAYHIYHPVNVLLNSGRASAKQIRGWVANRFYYQVNIPVKDAAILANCTDRSVRREWVLRILDQDGYGEDPGALESWVHLGDAVGLPAAQLWSMEHVLPSVRFAVDSYVNFARRQPWQEAVCASLTELFAPTDRERVATWPAHYTWIDAAGLERFRSRPSTAARDLQHCLGITLEHFRTREAQTRALQILRFKMDLLWSILDALQLRYGLEGE
ncbi:MAG TPA: pyrroloquinoline-quinone synthase PqqC [Steroidobacteraceae bacterium]|nr:pyrroloquinoline-quinone synthase PqqC [Steroidobacteraceae bacterium]